jgi:hypothetical protein
MNFYINSAGIVKSSQKVEAEQGVLNIRPLILSACNTERIIHLSYYNLPIFYERLYKLQLLLHQLHKRT